MDREILKANGWKFASCITDEHTPELCARIRDEHRDPNAVYINATQDCSIINPNLEAEPWLEYFSAVPIERENGMFTNARNIRKLHIQVEVTGVLRWYELSMSKRGFIGREGMEESQPCQDIVIPYESINIFKRWIANRYVAQTFPDEFNRRISGLIAKSRSPLIRLFNTEEGKACNSVFITLTPDDSDLEEGVPYRLVVVLLYKNEKAIEIGREAMDRFAEQINAALEATDGIEAEAVISLAEQDITYDELVKMVRWQFDYVSLTTGEEVVPVNHITS